MFCFVLMNQNKNFRFNYIYLKIKSIQINLLLQPYECYFLKVRNAFIWAVPKVKTKVQIYIDK